MANNRMGTDLSQSKIDGFIAEGGSLGLRAIVQQGTNENQAKVCSAASDAPKGIVSSEGLQYGTASVIVEGPSEVVVGGSVTIGHRAILDATGQKAVSMETSPNTTDDEVWVLGDFQSGASTDGDIAVVDVNVRKEKNPFKTRKLIFPLATISATAAQLLINMPEAGIITAVKSGVTTSITADDTNYWAEQLTNVTQSATILENTGDVNTTKATGGAGYTADVLRSFTLESAASLDFASGDIFRYNLTKTASGANHVGKVLIIEYTKS